jgi:hypothetical protein
MHLNCTRKALTPLPDINVDVPTLFAHNLSVATEIARFTMPRKLRNYRNYVRLNTERGLKLDKAEDLLSPSFFKQTSDSVNFDSI